MIIKISSDKEKARSILQLTKEREDFVKSIDHNKFSTNAVENYYEIIKELAGALLLLDGLKSIGDYAHKDLIDYLINYREFQQKDIIFINNQFSSQNPRSCGFLCAS